MFKHDEADHPLGPKHFILVDWGTSNFRAFLLDADGARVAEHRASHGIKRIQHGTCPDVLCGLARKWGVLHGDTSALMAGMVGSELGWQQVPLVPAPCGVKDLAGHLAKVTAAGFEDISIVPGVLSHQKGRLAGMMRGEEAQSMGALALQGLEDAVICLPGSHSKWVEVQKSTIAGISTFMTGELFEVVSKHSVLQGLVDQTPNNFDVAGFREGLALAHTDLNVMQLMFSIRTEAVASGKSTSRRNAARLSGILIGSETRAALAALDISPETTVHITAEPRLLHAYSIALREYGQKVVAIDAEQAFLAGCDAILKAGRALLSKDPVQEAAGFN